MSSAGAWSSTSMIRWILTIALASLRLLRQLEIRRALQSVTVNTISEVINEITVVSATPSVLEVSGIAHTGPHRDGRLNAG